jgi:hypothetical protein
MSLASIDKLTGKCRLSSLNVLSQIHQPRLVCAHVASLLPHARDPNIRVSVFPHEWHSLVNYLCASCLEANADERIVEDVQQLLASAGVCPPFASHFRSPLPQLVTARVPIFL